MLRTLFHALAFAAGCWLASAMVIAAWPTEMFQSREPFTAYLTGIVMTAAPLVTLVGLIAQIAHRSRERERDDAIATARAMRH